MVLAHETVGHTINVADSKCFLKTVHLSMCNDLSNGTNILK